MDFFLNNYFSYEQKIGSYDTILSIIILQIIVHFPKMTSCKLRVKLRVTFSELFVEEYRKIELVGRSVFLTHKFLHIQHQISIKVSSSV